MPFIGQDWRGPGGTWVRVSLGWENKKFQPLQSSDYGSAVKSICRVHSESESSNDEVAAAIGMPSSSPPKAATSVVACACLDVEKVDERPSQPHCFVKNKTEFVGCTSISEAFLKLDLCRGVTDVRRFNYISKVIQILVGEKLQNLSGSARKVLLSLIEATVIHCMDVDVELSTVRNFVSDFINGLSQGHHCGSLIMVNSHKECLSSLYAMLTSHQPTAPADSNEDSLTILDLPVECVQMVLRELPDHNSLLGATEVLKVVAKHEMKLWEDLCKLHFNEQQMSRVFQKLGCAPSTTYQIAKHKSPNWRHIYFELKKYYGLREVYADMIHICCHCKALYWKDLGHPCVSKSPAPAVRVTPEQFIDMLLYI